MGEIKFKNIKHILRKQIDNGVKSLWTYNEIELEFTQIYKNYNDKLPIYTAKQLLNKLSN